MTWIKSSAYLTTPTVLHADPHLDARGFCACTGVCCIDSTDGKCKCSGGCACSQPAHGHLEACALCRPFPVSCRPVTVKGIR